MPDTDPAPIDLTPEQLRAIQLASLDIFSYLLGFCEEHGLRVFFDFGNLLGAVRGRGFIPWDDDIDVSMPRPDFERFLQLWPQHADTERYSYVFTTQTLVTQDPVPKIIDNNTTCVISHHRDLDMPQGLAIDIFPLDGCPDSRLGRALQVMWGLIYNLFSAQFVPDNYGKTIEIGCRLLLGLVRTPRARHRLWRFAESRMTATPFGSTKTVRSLYGGPAQMLRIYPVEDFAETVQLDFEGMKVPAPIGYERYLEITFGDYMTLPPPEERKPHHNILFLDLDTPYERYRGVHYRVSSR